MVDLSRVQGKDSATSVVQDVVYNKMLVVGLKSDISMQPSLLGTTYRLKMGKLQDVVGPSPKKGLLTNPVFYLS